MTGRGVHSIKCQACGRHMSPGAALRVYPVDGSEPYAVHRHSFSSACLLTAGPRSASTIAFYDPEAARAVDRYGGADG